MSVFKYSKYKILIDPKSHKTQGLSVGDVVRRQYVDASGTIYSLMLVLETGVDMITSASGEQNQSHYFVGALLEGDEPTNGQLLDFVRTTNLFNLERSGALYLTASDSASPYMDVIDGMSVDKSMCFPYMGGGSPNVADPTKYAIQGANYVTTAYSATKTDASRVFRATRNSVANTDNAFIGLKQSLSATLSNPQRVVVSYKIRGSKAASSIPVSFGYTSWENMDGVDSTSVSTSWAYKVHIITIDYPAENPRSLYIDLRNILTKENDWCEIADLNIVLLSDIANFNNASKARVGKLSGIVDPIFGVMDGYGAYFQNLFATKNVNVSGTLTAGDENGSASTFYVGRIHKNSFINSLSPKFSTDKHEEDATAFNPAGVGKVFQLHTGTSIMSAQTREWLNSKIGRKYSLSFWMRSEDLEPISVSLAGRTAEEVSPTVAGEWEKIHITTILTNPKDVSLSLSITVNGASVLFTAPQLEAGGRVSLYQPTDDVLRDTDEYGAWFNKGGIGGTIQNPLLKLNEDGSISSANGSFVINSDGSGYFANGAIKWGDKGVEFGEEVTLAWREQTDAQINNISVGSRNYILGTAKSKTFTGNATANQPVWAYNMSPDKEDLGDQICTFSFDWVAEGDSISGSFLFHNRVSPWGQMSLGVRISADNKSGRYTRTWRTTSDNMATMAQLGIRMDNVPSGTTITVSNMSLVLGNKTVGWSEAPEDINSRISSAQSTADSSVTALGGSSFPKLTKIDSTGVYTGTLTATQVNAVEINASSIKTGTLSADRIAANSISGDKIVANSISGDRITAGSITSTQINTSSLQSALITTSYIQGLSLNFTKGKIGSWSIDSEGIYNGKTKLTAAGAIYQTGQAWCFRSDGSGYLANKNIEWDTNGNVTFSDAVKLSWTSYTDQKVQDISVGGRNLLIDSTNLGNEYWATRGAISLTNNYYKGARIYKTSTAWSSRHYTAAQGIEAGKECVFSFYVRADGDLSSMPESAGLYVFGADTNIRVFSMSKIPTEWQRIKIAVRTSDNQFGVRPEINTATPNGIFVYFCGFQLEEGNKATDWTPAPEDVQTDISNLQSQANATDITLTSLQTTVTNNDTAARELAMAQAFGKMLYRDPVFYNGVNSTKAYNNDSNGNVVVTRVSDTTAPNDSKMVLKITNTGASEPDCGGFSFGNQAAANKRYVTRIIAKIPSGRKIAAKNNTLGNGTTVKWLTSQEGTGAWSEYIYTINCGSSGTFSTANFFYMTGAVGTVAAPVEWRVAYATVFDITSSEKYTTTIDANGIYTGTLTANQVNAVAINASSISAGTLSADRIAAGSLNGNKITAGTISADRITAGSITSTQINVASLQASLVTVDHIQGLTISFSKGKIGSWVINSSDITNGTVRLAGNGTIWHTGSKWRMGYDGAGYLASGNISWDASGNVTFADSVKLSWTSYADSLVDNIQVGGRNLIRGTSQPYFDQSLWGYTGWSSTRPVWNDTENAIEFSATNGWQASSIALTQPAANQEDVTISFKAKAKEGFDIVPIHLGVNNSAAWSKTANFTPTSEWVEYKFTFKATGARLNITIRGVDSSGKTYKALIKDLMFEKANKASSWSPAPEDINERVSTAQTAVSGITTALGGSSYPKLTQISATGIYTGSITAAQITVGTISVDRLDAAAIKSSVINTSYIQGLSLAFTKGTVGGWIITSNAIRHASSSNRHLIINNAETDSPAGSNRGHRGITMYNDDSAVATGAVKIVQIGALADKNTAGTWSTETNYGFRIAIKGGTDIFRADSSGAQIAGWSFNSSSISKGNISLGSDGTIKHASAWALNNDGSGRLAKGDISWDTSGNVTINANVKISGSAIAKAITTDSLQVGSNFSVAKDGTLTAVNGVFSGTISGVSGTFRSLKAINDSGGTEAEITFSSSGGLWFSGDMYHQGRNQGRSQRFYSSDIWCRGTFGHASRSVLIVYGSYGYVYTDPSASGSYVSFSTVSSGVYSIPLYSLTDATSGLPIDIVLIRTTSSYKFAFPQYKYKTVDIMNLADNNNDVHVYTNGKTHQIHGGTCIRMMDVGAANMNPTVSASAAGAGWCIIGRYDNTWG